MTYNVGDRVRWGNHSGDMHVYTITNIKDGLYYLSGGSYQAVSNEFELDWFNKDWNGK